MNLLGWNKSDKDVHGPSPYASDPDGPLPEETPPEDADGLDDPEVVD
jgi:hypothetical protein